MMRIIYTIPLLVCCFSISFGQSVNETTESRLSNLMTQFVEAALKSDTSVAEKIYAQDMILTSQSGKVYLKKDALLDLKNPFEKYENSELRFIHLSQKVVVVNYLNTRQRKTLEEAKYRVTAVWKKNKTGWQIVSLQSTKILTQGM